MSVLIVAAGAGVKAQERSDPPDPRPIFNSHCISCHGPRDKDGNSRIPSAGLDLTKDLSEIADNGKVITKGLPSASSLYTMVESGAMPKGGSKLLPEEIKAIEDWINSLKSKAPFEPVSEAKILERIDSDLGRLEISDPLEAKASRYFTFANLYNLNTVKTERMNSYRRSLAFLVNSLSRNRAIYALQPVGEDGLIYRVDLRKLNWTKTNAWGRLLSVYPYGVSPQGFNKDDYAERIAKISGCSQAWIRADWFLANASVSDPKKGRLYYEILGLPDTLDQHDASGKLIKPGLETSLGFDPRSEEYAQPNKVNVIRAAFPQSGVSFANRLVERYEISSTGYYWRSYDFRTSDGMSNVIQNPKLVNSDAGEIIFALPNGLQGYYITDSLGQRVDKADADVVAAKNWSPPIVFAGVSCMGCHVEGIKPVIDFVRVSHPTDRAVQALFPEQAVLNNIVNGDHNSFSRAVTMLDDSHNSSPGNVKDVDPIIELTQAYSSNSVSINDASADLYNAMTPDNLASRINSDPGLRVGLGLGPLGSGGSVQRDTWEKAFGKLYEALGLGKQASYATVNVEIMSEPAGADVSIDGTSIGKSPLTYQAYLGPDPSKNFKLVLSLNGYSSTSAEIIVARDRPTRFSFKLSLASTLIEVLSDPPGGEVFLDGHSIGKTPLTYRDPVANQQSRAAEFRIMLEDFDDAVEVLELKRGGNQRITKTLSLRSRKWTSVLATLDRYIPLLAAEEEFKRGHDIGGHVFSVDSPISDESIPFQILLAEEQPTEGGKPNRGRIFSQILIVSASINDRKSTSLQEAVQRHFAGKTVVDQTVDLGVVDNVTIRIQGGFTLGSTGLRGISLSAGRPADTYEMFREAFRKAWEYFSLHKDDRDYRGTLQGNFDNFDNGILAVKIGNFPTDRREGGPIRFLNLSVRSGTREPSHTQIKSFLKKMWPDSCFFTDISNGSKWATVFFKDQGVLRVYAKSENDLICLTRD